MATEGIGATLGRGVKAGLAGTVALTAFHLLNTALGLYKPWRWSAQDWAIDVGEKLLLAEAIGLVYERLDARAG